MITEVSIPLGPMPAVYKIIATIMLQSGFEPRFRLGRNSQGIIEPIQVPVKGARYGFGYIRTDDDVKVKKNNDKELAKGIPHMYSQSGSMASMTNFEKESVAFSKRSMLLLRTRSS